MGWLFIPGSTRKSLIAERTQDWQRRNDAGTIIKSTCLAGCYRGNPFENDGEQIEPKERWIVCDLLRYSRWDEGWGYKDMDESIYPYFYSCPLGYLDMVPIEQFGGNAEWRAGVHNYHDRLQEKRRQKRATKK